MKTIKITFALILLFTTVTAFSKKEERVNSFDEIDIYKSNQIYYSNGLALD